MLSLGNTYHILFSIFDNTWKCPIFPSKSQKVERLKWPHLPSSNVRGPWEVANVKKRLLLQPCYLQKPSSGSCQEMTRRRAHIISWRTYYRFLLLGPRAPRVSANGCRHLRRTYVRYVPLCSVSLSFPFWYFPNRSQKRHFHKSCYANARQTPSSRPNTYKRRLHFSMSVVLRNQMVNESLVSLFNQICVCVRTFWLCFYRPTIMNVNSCWNIISFEQQNKYYPRQSRSFKQKVGVFAESWTF